jgi:hypothetical protein
MAKYKVNDAYTGECPTTLQGDTTPTIDNVLKFTEDRIEIMCTVCTQEQYDAGLEFEAEDLIAYIDADVTFGASRSVDEVSLPHAKSKFKITGEVTYDDTEMTMLMTDENYAKFRSVFNDNLSIAIAAFDKDNVDASTHKAPMLESLFGTISKEGTTYTNGGNCTYKFTFSPSERGRACVSPTYSE